MTMPSSKTWSTPSLPATGEILLSPPNGSTLRFPNSSRLNKLHSTQFTLCTRSIWRLVAAGELPHPILVGSARRWFESDVTAYLAKQTAKRDAKYQKTPRSRAA